MMHIRDDSRVTFGTKLSDRIWLDNNGQLIVRDAIIARTGAYDYLESEIMEDGSADKVVQVYRTDDEVFDPVSMASFENKPFCNNHPTEDVSPDNYHELQCGFIRNIRRGADELNNCLICDIIVTDADTIEQIKSGEKRELSLGYDTNIVMKDNRYIMTNIRGNHLALVNSGRAGCATIRDSANRFNNQLGGYGMSLFKNSKSTSNTLYDEEIIEVEEIKNDDDFALEAVEEVPQSNEVPEVNPQIDDVDPIIELKADIKEIKDMLIKLVMGKNDEVSDEGCAEDGIVDEDEGVKPDVVAEGEAPVVEDEDTVKAEVSDEDEVVESTEEEKVNDEDAEEDNELLDADELLKEEKVKTKDNKTVDTVYSKFAGLKDSAAENKSVTDAWKERYAKCNKNR